MSEPPRDPFGFHALSRRRFLRLGLLAASLGAGGYAALRAIGGSAPDVVGLRVLGDRNAATMAALARTLFPVAGGVVSAEVQDRLVFDLDHFMQTITPELATQLQLAITYLEAAPVVLDRRLDTFSQLTAPERDAHFRTHWERTDDDLRRALGTAFVRLLSLWCYDTPALWARMHYPGPLLEPMPLP